FRMAGALEDEGVVVNPIVSPAVPPDSALIRLSVMASLGRDDLEVALEKMTLVGRKHGVV
ncbi:MAG: 8-amino-7-oxononanoate synthase, partial [Candidatus Eisenbacteria bacterium]|nr:8-amino-7-oxononanoate synthase [Candidatus Eisenbacteria bacterium]